MYDTESGCGCVGVGVGTRAPTEGLIGKEKPYAADVICSNTPRIKTEMATYVYTK